MVATVLYLPGIQEKQLIKKLVDLGDLIRADIHRYLRYEVKSEKEIDTQKVYILMKRCKSRILGRLEKVIKMPSEYDKTDEEWEEILKKSLEKIQSIEITQTHIQEKIQTLIGVFRNDTTSSKVHYAIQYMKIIAGIDPKNTIIPFHP